MAAPKFNFIIDQGSDFAYSLNFKRDGEPMPLTGYSVRGQIREKPSSTTVIASFVGTTVDAALGQFRISLTSNTTAALVPGLYVYDVEIYNGSNVSRVLQGNAKIEAEVTK